MAQVLLPTSSCLKTSKSMFKKTKWTAEEDNLLIESVKKNGLTNWTLVASEVNGRTGKQCRERWMNQLCPALNKDTWKREEDITLIKQQRVFGNSWSKIAYFLPGRSSNAVKNRWGWLSRHGLALSMPNIAFPLAKPLKKNAFTIPTKSSAKSLPFVDIKKSTAMPESKSADELVSFEYIQESEIPTEVFSYPEIDDFNIAFCSNIENNSELSNDDAFISYINF